MSEVARPAARATRAPKPVRRAHCELDDWTFDPRYTGGRCPICGWEPPGAPDAPLWLKAARRFEWELTGLLALLVVLVVLAAVVAHAAGYRIPLLNGPVRAPVLHVASPVRATHATPTPSARPSGVGSPRPTPTR